MVDSSKLNEDLAATHNVFRRKKKVKMAPEFEVDEVKSGMWSVEKKAKEPRQKPKSKPKIGVEYKLDKD